MNEDLQYQTGGLFEFDREETESIAGVRWGR